MFRLISILPWYRWYANPDRDRPRYSAASFVFSTIFSSMPYTIPHYLGLSRKGKVDKRADLRYTNGMSQLAQAVHELSLAHWESRRLLDKIEALLGVEESAWSYPVGNAYWPTERWYAASLHDTTGKLNDGYAHTGIDLNMDKAPWGDVDRGQPVFAIASGIVHNFGYSKKYLGSVIIEVRHDDAPLYVRYWHLEPNTIFNSHWTGNVVKSGQVVGHIGNYTVGAGGDHLHFDMALQPIGPHWWFSRHPEIDWPDPVPILETHLDPDRIKKMLKRG